MTQDTSIELVSEENALIAVSYGENKTFVLTNNTDSTIRVEGIRIQGEGTVLSSFPSSLMRGASTEFVIDGDSKVLVGLEMDISIQSENGRIQIKSVLPQFIIEEEDESNAEEQGNEEKIDEEVSETETKKEDVPKEENQNEKIKNKEQDSPSTEDGTAPDSNETEIKEPAKQENNSEQTTEQEQAAEPAKSQQPANTEQLNSNSGTEVISVTSDSTESEQPIEK